MFTRCEFIPKTKSSEEAACTEWCAFKLLEEESIMRDFVKPDLVILRF